MGETRAPDAANELADGLEAAEQSGSPGLAETHGPPTEEAAGQPANPTADQEATEADGAPIADARESG